MGCPQLPLDCLLEILEKLTNDTKSLYSCLLVNRIWCQTAIPILWKKPLHDDFSFKFNQNQWNSLSRDEKKPMFNYIEFIQYISTESVHKLITCLLSNPFIDRKSTTMMTLPPKFSFTHNETLLEKELWKIFMKYNITLKHIEHPIFPIFIYSDALLRLNCLSHLECSPVDLGTLIFEDLSSVCQNLEKLTLNYKNGVAESVGNDTLIPKSEHIKSYYQSLIRYCPNLEVVKVWYSDEYKNDFESLIKSCRNLKEITLIFADNLLGNNDIDDDSTLSFIFNTLLNYVDDNFTVLNFGEGWKINVRILNDFLQQWKDKKPLFIWYHMETDIFDDHLRVFEKFQELGVLKGWKRYF
ncbi:16535_t:CDS:2 [Rhizophagus irregularis]|nr:16535_t:CDS:2 [Rhizophagus irregularis]